MQCQEEIKGRTVSRKLGDRNVRTLDPRLCRHNAKWVIKLRSGDKYVCTTHAREAEREGLRVSRIR